MSASPQLISIRPAGLEALSLAAPASSPVRLSGKGAARAMERAVLRPVDLSRTHGVNFTPEILRRLAATYDPAFEAAMVSFDHPLGGPAHGHAVRLWMDGEFLWGRFEGLSDEAYNGIESGQWPRCSSEVYTSHPVLKDWYFFGLTLLGAKSPAVPGLGQARLLSAPVYRLITLDTETRSETAEHAAPANGEEKTEDEMSKKTEETPAGAETKTPETPAAPAAPATLKADPPTQPSATDADVAQLSARVQGELAKLEADRTTLSTQLSAIRLERAEVATEKLLSGRLTNRLTPAQVKLARPLLVALAAAEAPAAVRLAGADGKPADVPVLDRLVQILEAGPDHGAHFARIAEPAPGEGAAVTLSQAEREAGVTEEQAARALARYPDAFAQSN